MLCAVHFSWEKRGSTVVTYLQGLPGASPQQEIVLGAFSISNLPAQVYCLTVPKESFMGPIPFSLT